MTLRSAALLLSLLAIPACSVEVPELEQSDVFYCQTDEDCIQGYRCFQERCVDRIINPDVLGCSDLDEDGFYSTSACGLPVDCDDEEPASFPGNTEICDGLDNDCDNDIDEGFNKLGDTCFAGQGECQAQGVFACTEDGSATACNAVVGDPVDEVCNDSLDNDCDGLTDLFDPDCIGCTQGDPCGSPCTNVATGETLPDDVCPCDGVQECSVGGAGGVCRAEGVDNTDERRCETCSAGQLECQTTDTNGQIVVGCIGADKLCDGNPDCNNGRDELGCDACAAGQLQCDNLECVPAAALCDGNADCGPANAVAPFSRTDTNSDGVDDDCNGIIDG